MPIFWFLAGVLTTLAVIVAALPWLRKTPRYASLPALPRGASIAVVVGVAAILGVYRWLGHADIVAHSGASSSTPILSLAPGPSGSFGSAVKAFADAGSAADPAAKSNAGSANSANAGSMDIAIANLESRLGKGGGSDGDWELLAKSFEFLGRPADAAKARARQLPPLPAEGKPSTDIQAPAPMASGTAGASRTAVSGEIMLAPDLKSKAAPGETLFIVAKSVDSPGAPVAVFRGSVGSWPLKFTLDDSQSMLPGRNLSSAGRVTIEARISQKGQPLPASGDLQGSSGVINPGERQPLKILIDRVIT